MIDVRKPLENPKLKELLKSVKEDEAREKEEILLDEVSGDAEFLIYIAIDDEDLIDGKISVDNPKITFSTLKTPEGKRYFPAFTDWEELKKGVEEKNPKMMILSFDDYSEMILETDEIEGFVINPFGEDFLIDKETVRKMTKKKSESAFNKKNRTRRREVLYRGMEEVARVLS